MGKCGYCGNEYEARRSTSKYCGSKCRKLAFQNGKVENAKDDEAGTLTEDEYIEPCMRPNYVCPLPLDIRKSDINYGPYMTANQLAAAGLKANRVCVPGDEDYDGVCAPTYIAENTDSIA